MPTFSSKPYHPTSSTTPLSFRDKLGAYYRRILPKHPFLLFGLPFIAIMVGGSFLLTPATALRYERHDRKVRQVTREEALGLGIRSSAAGLKDGEGEGEGKVNPRRRMVGSEREEYYVSPFFFYFGICRGDFGIIASLGRIADTVWFYRDLWRRIWTIGSRNAFSDGKASRTDDYKRAPSRGFSTLWIDCDRSVMRLSLLAGGCMT